MSDQSLTERTREFYGTYPFPGNRPMDQDGLILLRRFSRTVDRFEGGNPRRKFRVLDAGCGTGNTTLALAHRFPALEFIGIDQSDASLKEGREGARKAGLNNVQLLHHDLMKPLRRQGRFDAILCLGVLHHTADMKKVMVNLRLLLASKGEMYLWIYGKHGRYRHSLNIRLLNELRAVGERDADPVELAHDLISLSAENGVMNDLLQNIKVGALEQRAFNDRVWIADQFLNPHETLIEMRQLIRLAGASGFRLDHIVGMDESAARRLLPRTLVERFCLLSPTRRLIALDLLLKPERYFVILRGAPPHRKP